MKFANAWAVPREAVEARRQASNRRGRPLNASSAWQSIVAGDVDLSNVSRYRNRGVAHRYEMSAADVAFLASHEESLVGGAAGANSCGAQLQISGTEADLYLTVSLHDSLTSLVAAVPNQLGGVVVRVVSAEVWPLVVGDAIKNRAGVERLAPRAAIALDLMESGDPRRWVVAEQLMVVGD